MVEPLEDKYRRFERNTGIDLQAAIAGNGGESLDNYYTKTATDDLLADKVENVELSALNARVIDLEENPGLVDHGALTGLNDDDHTNYLNNTRGDLRYYTKGQVDTSLSSKSDTSHTHDSRYYTEAEVTALLSGKADVTAYQTAGTVTVLGTDTVITGLSVPLTNGTYEIKAWVPIVNVGSPTNTGMKVVADGTLVCSVASYRIDRFSDNAYAHSSVRSVLNGTALSTLASVVLMVVAGVFTVTTPGTLIFQGSRSGGTSQTVQTYAYVTARKLA